MQKLSGEVRKAALAKLSGWAEHIQLSVDWQDGLHMWIQTISGRLVLKSETVQAPADEIHLVTVADPEAIGCTVGDVGRYGWSRSSDGMFLTLTAIDDACANRRNSMKLFKKAISSNLRSSQK